MLVKVNGKAAGSEIVGQEFEGDQYFHGRISSVNYNTYTKEEKESGEYAGVSSGSFNYAPSSKDLEKRVEEDVKAFKERYKEVTGEEFKGKIPADMLTASGSGLDPHISLEAAKVQLPIVAAASGLSEEEVQNIVDNNTEKKLFGIFCEEKVNVLECNIDIIVAAASGLSEEEVQNIVDNNTEKKLFGIFCEEKVNVLECNIDIAEAMGE